MIELESLIEEPNTLSNEIELSMSTVSQVGTLGFAPEPATGQDCSHPYAEEGQIGRLRRGRGEAEVIDERSAAIGSDPGHAEGAPTAVVGKISISVNVWAATLRSKRPQSSNEL